MLISEVFKEDLDPKGPEVTIGDYTTTHFFMCGSAIETAEKHADKPGMERLIRLQDMVYKLEKAVMDTGESTDEAHDLAHELHDAVMAQATCLVWQRQKRRSRRRWLGSLQFKR